MLWPRKFSLCLSTFTSSQLNSADQDRIKKKLALNEKIPYVRESLAKFRKDTSTGALVVYQFNNLKGWTMDRLVKRNVLDKQEVIGVEINP